jgi:PAS domain-containing protein
MIELAQNSESHELSEALEKLGQEAARLQTVIDTVPSFLWTSLPDGSKEYLNKRWYEYTGLSLEEGMPRSRWTHHLALAGGATTMTATVSARTEGLSWAPEKVAAGLCLRENESQGLRNDGLPSP